MAAEVETFRGPVAPSALGTTLIHEHVFVGHPELDLNLPHPEWCEDVAIETAVAGLERLWGLGVRTVVDAADDGWSRVEFQMLYGVRRDLQADLARRGYPVRVYIPYGTEWYPYYMRRLAERPQNVMFMIVTTLREGRGNKAADG